MMIHGRRSTHLDRLHPAHDRAAAAPRRLRLLGWQPCMTQTGVEWRGHAQEYVPWPEADGYWRMVPVLG